MKRYITVEELVGDREEGLGLENLSPDADLGRPITHPDPGSPGLALAGFTERVVGGRIQVFGETEMAYLASLEPDVCEERLRYLFRHELPVVFVTKELEVGELFLGLAKEYGVPVFRTSMGTGQFFQR